MRFKAKCQVPHWDNSPVQHYRLGEEMESGLAEKDLEDAGQQLADYEPAVFLGGQEGQRHPGLCQK